MPGQATAPKAADAKDIFNHVLAHHVAHWAAYVAMIGVQLTIAFALCMTPVPPASQLFRKIGIGLVIASATIGALYFMKGMDRYGGMLHDRLPEDYIRKSTMMPHGMMIGSSALAALALAVLDYALLIFL